MSRHIRAKTTPTHASGFHLFTVAMTGHAEDKGVQLPQQVTLNRSCPNAVKESRSERVGFYRNEQGGFACLALLKIVYLFIGVIDLIVGTTSTKREQHRQTEKEHNQCNATICCMNVTWQYAVVCANATKTRLNEVGLNQRVKFNSICDYLNATYLI